MKNLSGVLFADKPTLKHPNRHVATSLLQEARRIINLSYRTYTCYALDDAVKSCLSEEFSLTCKALKKVIEIRLGEQATLETWLVKSGYPAFGNAPKVKETRLAWIDSLIEELSE